MGTFLRKFNPSDKVYIDTDSSEIYEKGRKNLEILYFIKEIKNL